MGWCVGHVFCTFVVKLVLSSNRFWLAHGIGVARKLENGIFWCKNQESRKMLQRQTNTDSNQQRGRKHDFTGLILVPNAVIPEKLEDFEGSQF